MEVVPIIDRISDFEAGISRLQHPSVKAVVGFHNLLTWGALALALIAAFGSLIRRVKLLVLLRVHAAESVIKSTVSSYYSDEDDDESDVEDDEASSCSSSDDEDYEDESDVDVSMLSSEMDFRVAGAGDGGGDGLFNKSVVKLWDGLGLGLADGCTGSAMAGWDLNLAEKVLSFSAGWSSHVLALCSPSALLNAGDGEDCCRTAVKVWDARVGSRTPVTEWAAPGSEILGVGGVKKVYSLDGRRLVSVRDMRMVGTSLPEEAEEMEWYDAVAMFDPKSPQNIDGSSRESGMVHRRRRHG